MKNNLILKLHRPANAKRQARAEWAIAYRAMQRSVAPICSGPTDRGKSVGAFTRPFGVDDRHQGYNRSGLQLVATTQWPPAKTRSKTPIFQVERTGTHRKKFSASGIRHPASPIPYQTKNHQKMPIIKLNQSEYECTNVARWHRPPACPSGADHRPASRRISGGDNARSVDARVPVICRITVPGGTPATTGRRPVPPSFKNPSPLCALCVSVAKQRVRGRIFIHPRTVLPT